MSDQIKELVKRFRSNEVAALPEYIRAFVTAAADALEAMAGEVERLKGAMAASTKHAQLLNKMLGEAEAERDRLAKSEEGLLKTLGLERREKHAAQTERDSLKAALEPFAKLETYRGAHDPAEGTMRMRVVTVPEIEAARKALGGDA